jgi:P-type Cu+ transporter
VLNETWVAAEVVLIALIGESLEALTFRRSQRELEKLLSLQPRTVHLREGETVRDAPLADVRPGDLALIRPGERIPVDGTIVSGRSSIDESSLTGESIPAEKEPGEEIFAGTLNQYGSLEVRVRQAGEHSVLGQMLAIVASARRNKADVERLVDRFARIFLPAVLVIAAGTFLVTNRERLPLALAGESLAGPTWEWMPTLAVSWRLQRRSWHRWPGWLDAE